MKATPFSSNNNLDHFMESMNLASAVQNWLQLKQIAEQNRPIYCTNHFTDYVIVYTNLNVINNSFLQLYLKLCYY